VAADLRGGTAVTVVMIVLLAWKAATDSCLLITGMDVKDANNSSAKGFTFGFFARNSLSSSHSSFLFT
jgi:hypothetical protein